MCIIKVGAVKKRKLIKEIKKLGFKFARHGASHDIFSLDGKGLPIPRHREINEMLAQVILKNAERISNESRISCDD